MSTTTRWRAGCRCFVAGLLGIVVGAASGDVDAQDLQRITAAKALYEHAVAAMNAGDYETACRKLEDAAGMEDKAVGLKLTLAECYERWGRLATAWTAYAVAEEAAFKANQPERQKLAHDLGEALRPRLARLTIEVSSEVRALPGLRIERDGFEIGQALWGVPIPVDRGRHTIVVKSTGRRSLAKELNIADGATITVRAPMHPKLVIDVPAGVRALPALEVLLDNTPIEKAQWGVPILVDKNHYIVRARAENTDTFEMPIEIEDGITFTVKVPMLKQYHVVRGAIIRPGDRAPERGVRLHIDASDPRVVLAHSFTGATATICISPCNATIEPLPGQSFFFGGEGVPESSSFTLDSMTGDVTANVVAGSSFAYNSGLTLIILGGLSALIGGAVLVLPRGEGSPYVAAGATTIGVGSAAAIGGIVLNVSNRTTFSFSGLGVAVAH